MYKLIRVHKLPFFSFSEIGGIWSVKLYGMCCNDTVNRAFVFLALGIIRSKEDFT